MTPSTPMSATTGLFGEGGNDLFKVEPDNFGADAFDGGTGTDTVDFDFTRAVGRDRSADPDI